MDALATIGRYTTEGAVILLMGCMAGASDLGSRLLEKLSLVRPARTVVAFATLGYRHPGEMARRGTQGSCMEAGMRDTDATTPNHDKFDKNWKDLRTMPWASEHSPNAKIARDGVIVKYPTAEGPTPLPESPALMGIDGFEYQIKARQIGSLRAEYEQKRQLGKK